MKEINELKVYKPSVNFILLKTSIKINFKEELLKSNILIRSCSNYEGLDNSYYRIAVRTHEENSKLVKNIRKIFEEYK